MIFSTPMDINFIYITNNEVIGAAIAQMGVRWVMVDLEVLGKSARQGGRDTIISHHNLLDVHRMRKAINLPRLLVRINPMGLHSEEEINSIISLGADAVMLPFFTSRNEVAKFIKIVNKRCKVFLLLETLCAIRNLDEILELEGIDYIHIGLNDLHIERRTTFMFEFLTDGSIDPVVRSISERSIPFGVGGVGKSGKLVPSAECILTEHVRIGSSGVILSRSFMNQNLFDKPALFLVEFENELNKLLNWLKSINKENSDFLNQNKKMLINQVNQVVIDQRALK